MFCRFAVVLRNLYWKFITVKQILLYFLKIEFSNYLIILETSRVNLNLNFQLGKCDVFQKSDNANEVKPTSAIDVK